MREQTLDKTYDPHSVEQKWYELWLEKGYFKPDRANSDQPYCIVTAHGPCP